MTTIRTTNRKPVVTMLGVVTLVLGLLALVAPLTRAEFPAARVGGLLALAACVEVLHALRRSSAAARRQATIGAVISMAMALFLINAPYVATRALTIVIAGWFGVDALRNAIAAFRARNGTDRPIRALAAVGNTVVALLILLAHGWLLKWIIAVAGALRIFGIAWNITVAAVYTTTEADESILAELGLADLPEAAAIASDVAAGEHARAPADRAWTMAFIVTLLAIHAGRMSVDVTLLGLISPAVAVLGDMFVAVLITLLVLNPLQMAWHGPTRWIERRVWGWHLRHGQAASRTWIGRITEAWLRFRLRLAIRLRETRYSIPAVLNLGLQRGLPVAAVIAATVPIWGMSWYFDTENWAAGMWNSWAESRTDTWRQAMVTAVVASEGGRAGPLTFAVTPGGPGGPGSAGSIDSGDFSFIVIGDTGEGDASQHVLRDQLLSVANTPDVKFVVISSDVVYPTGAMKDYEAKFWLPFKGVSRPVYAIPGNHDWYDALEGFAVTFLQPDAARRSIRARVEADLRVTSTTDGRIDNLLSEADRLRHAYAVPTGFQRAPFFEIQTDRFTLVAIDTGVLRTVDPAQWEWLEAALNRAAGRFTMAIVGHPFYAGGHDLASGDEEFGRLKELLLRHGVAIMMAGDTHDLEYYVEPGSSPATSTHYFVNGGGGAYLSFGTSLAWPDHAATADWAHYPNLADVTRKIRDFTPWWKRPAWWWTDRFRAWPFSAEWLSAAFDYNVAPFFQSFVEVRVERSANRVRVIPYGVHGRLAWRDLAASDGLRASAGADGALVEWVVPLRPAPGTP